MTRHTISDGISNIVRQYNSGSRNTPNPEQNASGFYIGIVMDDTDDSLNGRVWVYIPAFSEKNFGVNAIPTSATPRDRETGVLDHDQELRQGWILCSPLLPFYGSDSRRVSQDSNGRNAQSKGDVNSYGFWTQTRIGDEVGVLFSKDDAARAYYIGSIPTPFSNFAMPGPTGVEPDTIDQDILNALVPTAPSDSLIPAMDKTRDTKSSGGNRRFDDVQPSASYLMNLALTGLLCDPFRGAGRSGARRESPSYVMGFKSAGWTFDSEKMNTNSTDGLKFDGTPVGQPPAGNSSRSRYQTANATGHQLIFDDHPDSQSVRIRTSAGSQIYFNDGGTTGEAPNDAFIYINTAKGAVWIELQDDGDISVFGEGSFSVHAQSDINLTADGDINMEAGGNLNVKVDGNQNTEVAGNVNHIVHGGTFLDTAGLDINSSGGIALAAASALDMSGESATRISSGGAMDIFTGSTLSMTGGSTVNMLSGGNLAMTAGFEVGVTGTRVSLSAIGGIGLNSGAGPVAGAAGPASKPSLPVHPSLNLVGDAPTPAQIASCTEPSSVPKLAPVVPQHQPWSGRIKATNGFRGFIDERADPPPVRSGAAVKDAVTPLSVTGRIGGAATPSTHIAQPYTSNAITEAPVFEDAGPPADGTLNDPSTYSASTRIKNFIKKEEGLVTRRAYLDAGKAWAIGYGHNVKIGDTINGEYVGKAYISQLYRTNGVLSITTEEADRIFSEDLSKFETGVRNGVTTPMTQGQFDAMVSFSYNLGVGAFSGSTMLARFNAGRTEEVPNEWMRWVRVSGSVHSGLQARRQEELEKFFVA